MRTNAKKTIVVLISFALLLTVAAPGITLKTFAATGTIHHVTLNNQNAMTAGTTQAWYRFGQTGSYNGMPVYYYANSACTTPISTSPDTWHITLPTRSGSTFGGYYTQPGGGGTRYIDDTGCFVNNLYASVDEDITLYAKWTSHHITLNPEGADTVGTTDAYFIYRSTGTYNGTLTYYYSDPNCTTPISTTPDTYHITVPTKEHMTFKGYFTERYGAGTQYIAADGGFINNLFNSENRDVTLYAYWVGDLVHITFDNGQAANSGTTDAWYQYKTTGTYNGKTTYYYSNPACTTPISTTPDTYYISLPSGYGSTFLGYYSQPNGGGRQYVDTDGQCINNMFNSFYEDFTLYANWDSIRTTFDNQGADTPGTTEIYYAYNVQGNYNGQATYYYTNPACSVPISTSPNTYTLTIPARTGYRFGGYFTGRNGTGTQYVSANGEFTNNLYSHEAQPRTLYAKWENNDYYVTYNAGEGTGDSVTENATYETDYAVRNSDGYSMTGYGFAGWLCSNGNTYQPGATVRNLTAEDGGTVTMTATWEANDYMIAFDGTDCDSGTMDDTIPAVYDENVLLPACAFAKTGYHFDGWSLTEGGAGTIDDKATVSNLTATADATVTLYATWVPNTDTTYTVNYYTMDEAGNYGVPVSETHTGTTDTDVNVADYVNVPAHFTLDTANTSPNTNIAGDGSAVVNIYYARDQYSVTFLRHFDLEELAAITGVYYDTAPDYEAPEFLKLDGEPDVHYKFIAYDRDFDHISEDTTVKAIYAAYPHTNWSGFSDNGDGTHARTCLDCGYVENAAHTAADAVRENENPATCGASGSYEAVTRCADCGAELSREEKEIAATGEHSFTNYVYNNDATCTANGTETAVCDNCTATDTREAANTKLDHSFTTYEYNNDATCLANGTETAVCDNCTATDTREASGTKLDHVFSEDDADWEVITQATCTAYGAKKTLCTLCGVATKTAPIDPTGVHSFVKVRTVAATCVGAGYDEYICSVCGLTEQRNATAIDPANHAKDPILVGKRDATETEDGYTGDLICPACGETITEGHVEPKTAVPHEHDFAALISHADATCAAKAYDIYACACGETKKIETGEVNPDNHVGLVTVGAKDATETEYGYTGDTVCTACGSVLAAGEVIEKTVIPHVHSFSTVIESGAATCVAKAYTVKQCECGETERTETGEVNPDNHAGSIILVGAREATATMGGYTGDKICTACGETVETGTFTDPTDPGHTHDYAEIVETGEATCVAKAYTIYQCACGDTKKVETGSVDPANHAGEIKTYGAHDATDTLDGYTGDKVCAACGKVVEAGSVIPHTGNTDPDTPTNPDTPDDGGNSNADTRVSFLDWLRNLIKKILALFNFGGEGSVC